MRSDPTRWSLRCLQIAGSVISALAGERKPRVGLSSYRTTICTLPHRSALTLQRNGFSEAFL